MSKKQNLISIFNDYKGRVEALVDYVSKIKTDNKYTPEGRIAEIEKLIEQFKPIVQECHDNAVGIIDKGLVDLQKKWKENSTGRLSDAGYQSGLSNVIKMLELGAIHDKEDIQNIVDTYAGDFNALSVIKKVLKNSADKELSLWASMVPEDSRDKNKQLLEQLKGNIDRFISIDSVKHCVISNSKTWNSFNSMSLDIGMNIAGMTEFVETRLGDNLELVI